MTTAHITGSQTLPPPAEPLADEEQRADCFHEMGRAMWAVGALSTCGQEFAGLHDAKGYTYAIKRIRECLAEAEVYLREVHHAGR